MYWLRRLLLLLPGRRQARARELDEELRANLALAIEEAGDERSARRDFGSAARAREEARAVWFPGWDAIAQDVRFAFRTLSRAPVFTAVAVLSLALGTGAATALFSLVDTVVLKPLAYRDPGRLVYVREVVPALAHIYPSLPANIQHYRFWREQAQSFEGVAAIGNGSAMLYRGGEPEIVGVVMTTSNLFDVLGVRAERGRTFRMEEEQPGKNPVVVLTDSLWRRLGGSEQILGQKIRLGAAQCEVVGILPPWFRFPRSSELGPLSRLPEHAEVFMPIQQFWPGWGGDYDYAVIARLGRGIAMGQGVAELNLLEGRIAKDHGLQAGLRVLVKPLQETLSAPVRSSLEVLLAAVLVLVLIVCVNLANLLLARGSARAREFSLRIALGASRGRLLISATIETLILALAGGALGVAAAWAALRVFVRTTAISLPRLDEVQIDGRVLLFSVLLTLACGLLFGLIPALRLTRADPQTALRSESHTTSGSRQGLRLREWLVGGEVALSTLLLVLAGLLVSSLWHVLGVNRGFTGDSALDVSVTLPSQYRQPKDRAAFFDLAVERLRALPGVRTAAAASRVPLTGESNVNSVRPTEAPESRLSQPVMINIRFVSQDYFTALGIRLLGGRTIEAGDRDRNVAVVSERLAAKIWPGQSPLGQHIWTSGSGVRDPEVVGIVADVPSTQLEHDPAMLLYVPYWKFPSQVSEIVVRSTGDPRSLPEQIRRAIRAIDSGIPAPKMRTMNEIVSESVAQRAFQMRVAAAFGVAALLLAALGIYGVVAYGVTLRRRELGIRMALGARAGEVRRFIVWQGLRPVAIGLACGLAAALAAGGLVRGLLFGVQATDGATLSAVAAGLGIVATVACLLPAHSAARIEPSRVLREE